MPNACGQPLNLFNHADPAETTGAVLVAPGLLSYTRDHQYAEAVIGLAADLRLVILITSFQPGTSLNTDVVRRAAAVLSAVGKVYASKIVVLRNSSDEDPDALTNVFANTAREPRIATATGFHSIAPGWVGVCARRAPATAYAGRHAIGVARGWRTSTICLGTPETGVIRETYIRDGATTELWGIEVAADASSVALIQPGVPPRIMNLAAR